MVWVVTTGKTVVDVYAEVNAFALYTVWRIAPTVTICAPPWSLILSLVAYVCELRFSCDVIETDFDDVAARSVNTSNCVVCAALLGISFYSCAVAQR